MGRPWFLSLCCLVSVLPALGQTDKQIEGVQLEQLHWGYSSVTWNPTWKPVSAEAAAALETQLRLNPQDVSARIHLLNYWWHNGMRQERLQSVLWLIAHHPESPILGLDLAWLFPNERAAHDHYRTMHDDADFAQARELWDAVIGQEWDSPEVLHNAARFYEGTDPAKSAELARRLRNADPVGHGKLVDEYFNRVAPALRR